MNDPYRVLDLTPDAGENEIRQRYLELVRAFPPDQAPSGLPPFTRPTRRCATRQTRLKEQLFSFESKHDSFESLAADLHARLRDVRLPCRCAAVLGRPAMNDRVDVEAILDRFRDWLEDPRAQRPRARRDLELRFRLGAGAAAGLRDHRSGRGVHGAAARAEAANQERPGLDRTDRDHGRGTAAGDRPVPVRRAQGGPGRVDGGQGARRGLADLDEALVRGEREIEQGTQQIADESVRGLKPPSTISIAGGRGSAAVLRGVPPRSHGDRPARRPGAA